MRRAKIIGMGVLGAAIGGVSDALYETLTRGGVDFFDPVYRKHLFMMMINTALVSVFMYLRTPPPVVGDDRQTRGTAEDRKQ